MSTLVTYLAPDFTKPAVLPNGSIDENFNFHTRIRDKYAVLFFLSFGFYFCLSVGNHCALTPRERFSAT
jgi:peroxiredoxin (alkyl hydroperoxide reductase subunit C)